MEKQDKTIICKDCGKEFVFTVGEQNFFEANGLTHDPVRCVPCRRAKKQAGNKFEDKKAA